MRSGISIAHKARFGLWASYLKGDIDYVLCKSFHGTKNRLDS